MVNVDSNFYSPQHTVVPVGSAVQWEWLSNNHSVTSDSAGAFPASDVELTGYRHGPIIFANPGVYAYHCQVHVGMTGTITVN